MENMRRGFKHGRQRCIRCEKRVGAQAKYWLGKVVDGSCPVKHLQNECVESAKKKLDSLSS